MTLPETILGMKTLLLIVITTSSGVGGAGGITMIDHVTSDTPHIGTDVKLDYIIKELDQNKENNEKIVKELQDIRLAICSIDASNCRI